MRVLIDTNVLEKFFNCKSGYPRKKGHHGSFYANQLSI